MSKPAKAKETCGYCGARRGLHTNDCVKPVAASEVCHGCDFADGPHTHDVDGAVRAASKDMQIAALRDALKKAEAENKRLRSVIENGCSENVACQKCASGAATARSLCDKCFSAGMEFGHAHPEYTPEKKP
jgi:hypothetical protein